MKPLQGKTVLVTGVGRRLGIGYALCRLCGDLGANILYTYYNPYDGVAKLEGWDEDPAVFKKDFEGGGGTATSLEADLQNPDSPKMVFTKAIAVYGSVDVLINNACVSTTQDFLDIDAALLDAHYAVNMKAPALLCKEFVSNFHKQTGGKIINLTSGQSISVMQDELPYTITKAGLEMLTLQLSFVLRERGITVNAVDPGPTDTGWIPQSLRDELTKSGVSSIATPEEIAQIVLSFVHGEREGMTGTVLHAQQTV